MNSFYLSEIYIYPIKSLGGISLTESILEEKGLQYDRRWMLIDDTGKFITQRKHFELALLQVNIADGNLLISNKLNANQTISFSMEENLEEHINVNIWDDSSCGQEVSKRVSEWFSEFLKLNVRLVKMPNNEKRLVDQRYALSDEVVSFADGYPCLLIGQSSLNGLNQKLEVPILMDRFRPNFVFTGGLPHVEDSFSSFYLSNILFSAVKPCARCVLITIDQQTGAQSKEPLKTLANYRTLGKKIMFGQNLIHKGAGTIRVGDELKIQEWK